MTRLVAAIAIVAVLGACSCVGHAKRQTPEDNNAVVRGYMEEVLNRGQWDAWDRYFADRVVFNDMEFTKDFAMRMRESLHVAFPDLRLTIEDQIAEGDRVSTRVTFRGTHRGMFHGLAATGREFAYTGVAIDRIVDGRVVEMWHQADDATLLDQLTETGPED